MWMANIVRLLLGRKTPWRLRRLALFNLLATIYYIGMNSTGIYLMVFQLLPYIFSDSPGYFWCLLGGFLFLILNVVGNTILVITTDCSLKSFKRNKDSRNCREKWWMKCDKCFEAIPPRCHHCPMCDVCILKRDHHCFFLSTCVGLQNEKHFILLTHYLMIGTFFTAIIIIVYVNRVYGVEFHGVLTLFTLLPRKLFGYFFEDTVTRDQLLLVTMFYGSFTAGLSNAGLFIWHLLIALNGQTSYEITAGINDYCSKGYWGNFTSVFGPYWFLSCMVPLRIESIIHSNLSHKKGQSKKKFVKHKQR